MNYKKTEKYGATMSNNTQCSVCCETTNEIVKEEKEVETPVEWVLQDVDDGPEVPVRDVPGSMGAHIRKLNMMEFLARLHGYTLSEVQDDPKLYAYFSNWADEEYQLEIALDEDDLVPFEAPDVVDEDPNYPVYKVMKDFVLADLLSWDQVRCDKFLYFTYHTRAREYLCMHDVDQKEPAEPQMARDTKDETPEQDPPDKPFCGVEIEDVTGEDPDDVRDKYSLYEEHTLLTDGTIQDDMEFFSCEEEQPTTSLNGAGGSNADVVVPKGVDLEDFMTTEFVQDVVTESDKEPDGGMMGYLRSAFQTVFNWITNGFKVGYREARRFIVEEVLGAAILSGAVTIAKEFIEHHMDTLIKLITTAFKFMYRCVSGMPSQFVLSETMMDIGELMGKVFSLDTKIIAQQAVPQDGQPSWHLPLTAVFATLLAIFGSKRVDPMSFGVLWRSSGAIVGFIRGCAEGVSGFSHLVFGYSPEKAFPRTMKFNEWLVTHIEKSSMTAFARREGIRLYNGYLAERMEWSRLDMTSYFQTKCPLLFKDHSSLTSAFPKFRMQPPAFVFEGEPGHGKTHFMNLVLNGLYKMFREFGLIEPTLGFRDFSYAWTPGKKHMDGYANQAVPVLNDFGQEFEGASDVDAASSTFMHMIDSNPWYPSLAGMNDKGMCFDAFCVLISTMIPTSLWPNHFKRCSKPQAMKRRVTYAWKLTSRKWDASKEQMAIDDNFAEDDQWMIMDSKTNEIVTVETVITQIFTSVMEAVIKHENTFDKSGMMNIPSLDLALEKFKTGAYADRLVTDLPSINSVNAGLRAQDHLTELTYTTTWWETAEMKIAKMILTMSGNGFTMSRMLKFLFGFGVSLGFVMSYLHKDGVLSWLGTAKDQVRSVAHRVVDQVSTAFPDHKINGINYSHAKAKVGDQWVNMFVEDVEPQSKEVLLQKLIPSQFKKRMIGKHFPGMKIEDAHVSCKNEVGEHGVWGLVLDTQHLLVAKHYYDSRDHFTFETTRSKMSYLVDKKHVTCKHFSDLDQTLIRLYDVTICNGRNIHNRFPTDASILPAQQLQRTAIEGNQICRVRSVNLTKAYGTIANITCTSVDIPGAPGVCGVVYLDYKGQIIGIHVAGNGSKSFIVTLTFGRLQHAMAEMCDMAPPVNLYSDFEPQMNESSRVIDSVGLTVAARELGPYSPISRRSDLMKIPLKVDLPDEHDVANMGFLYSEDARTPVETIRLKDWDERMRHSVGYVWSVEDLIVSNMANQVTVKCSDKLVDWADLASNPGGMPSITRKSSAGPWFPGQNKGLFCEETEVPMLSATTLTLLKEYDNLLQHGVGFPTVSAMALKVERLPKLKVQEGKTRVFQACDALKYFIDRRYFGFIIAQLHCVLKVQTGVCYAATPEEVGAKFAALPDKLVATDISKQDNSHMRTAIVLMKFFLATGLVSNEGADFFVHPSLPLLNRDNRARFILLRDTGFGQRVYHNLLIDNCGGGLASGCLLTTLYNCLITWYGMEKVKLLYPSLVYVLFGDDVASNCTNFQLIKDTFDSIGFGVKGAGEDNVFIIENKKDTIFCGRKYVSKHKRMNLTRDRLSKIIRFITLRNTDTAYVSSMMNFLSELAYEDDYTEVVKSISFRGDYLADVLPTEMLTPSALLKPGFWSHRGDEDDDMTEFETLSLIVVMWMDRSGIVDFVEKTLDPIKPQMDKGKEEDTGASAEVPVVQPPSDTTGDEMVSVVTTDSQDISSFKGSEKDAAYSFVSNEINQFWSRPIRIATTQWTTMQDRDDVVNEFTGFTDVIDAATNYQLKLANTVGIKGVLRVFVVVNATPFQAGGLVLYGSPNARPVRGAIHAMTGPHAVITAGANQTASLDIPYNRELLWAPTHAYAGSLSDTYFDWVRVGLRVLDPLVVAAGASTAVNVQVLVQLVDMEVMQGTVTNFTFSPQMGPQVIADRAASAAGTVVKGIAGTAETVSKIAVAGGALLSKTSHTVSAEPFSYSAAHSIASYNGTDDSKTAALNASAHTIVHPDLHSDTVGSPTAVKNIASRPGVFAFIKYETLTQPDSILRNWWVHPNVAAGDLVEANFKTPCTYLASHFLYWRGTMTYKFTLFKTAFHSGTLEILVDYGGSANLPTTPSRSINLHRVYWDITAQSTITVSVPYRRAWHWCQLGNVQFNPVVHLLAVQPLIAGDNVSSSINVMVEQWSSDLQVAWPQRSLELDGEIPRQVFGAPPPSPAPPVLPVLKVPKRVGKVPTVVPSASTFPQPQMFEAFSKVVGGDSIRKQGNFDPAVTTHDLADHVFLGDQLPTPDQDEFAYRYIAGEEVTDVLQVARRFHYLSRESSTLVMNEFTYTQNTGTQLSTNERVGAWPLYIESMSKMFTYGTGGYRLKVVAEHKNHFATALVYLPTALGYALNNLSPGVPTIYQNSLERPSLEIEVPNVTQFFYYRLETSHEGNQPGNRPNLMALIKYESDAPLGVWFALSDDVTWGGQNYLPEAIVQLSEIFYNPSSLV